MDKKQKRVANLIVLILAILTVIVFVVGIIKDGGFKTFENEGSSKSILDSFKGNDAKK